MDSAQLYVKTLLNGGMTRYEIAKALRLHWSTVDRWLKGKTHPTKAKMQQLKELASGISRQPKEEKSRRKWDEFLSRFQNDHQQPVLYYTEKDGIYYRVILESKDTVRLEGITESGGELIFLYSRMACGLKNVNEAIGIIHK